MHLYNLVSSSSYSYSSASSTAPMLPTLHNNNNNNTCARAVTGSAVPVLINLIENAPQHGYNSANRGGGYSADHRTMNSATPLSILLPPLRFHSSDRNVANNNMDHNSNIYFRKHPDVPSVTPRGYQEEGRHANNSSDSGCHYKPRQHHQHRMHPYAAAAAITHSNSISIQSDAIKSSTFKFPQTSDGHGHAPHRPSHEDDDDDDRDDDDDLILSASILTQLAPASKKPLQQTTAPKRKASPRQQRRRQQQQQQQPSSPPQLLWSASPRFSTTPHPVVEERLLYKLQLIRPLDLVYEAQDVKSIPTELAAALLLSVEESELSAFTAYRPKRGTIYVFPPGNEQFYRDGYQYSNAKTSDCSNPSMKSSALEPFGITSYTHELVVHASSPSSGDPNNNNNSNTTTTTTTTYRLTRKVFRIKNAAVTAHNIPRLTLVQYYGDELPRDPDDISPNTSPRDYVASSPPSSPFGNSSSSSESSSSSPSAAVSTWQKRNETYRRWLSSFPRKGKINLIETEVARLDEQGYRILSESKNAAENGSIWSILDRQKSVSQAVIAATRADDRVKLRSCRSSAVSTAAAASNNNRSSPPIQAQPPAGAGRESPEGGSGNNHNHNTNDMEWLLSNLNSVAANIRSRYATSAQMAHLSGNITVKQRPAAQVLSFISS